MKCLITGGDGFIGSYLADYLLGQKQTVFILSHRPQALAKKQRKAGRNRVVCDILDENKLRRILRRIKPDFIFHLAAQSLIMPSWENPQKTFQINILGTLHLFQTVLAEKLDPVMVVAGSSSEYATSRGETISENDCLAPSSPYGVSKVAVSRLAYLYWKHYGLKILSVRPFFVIGPGKKKDVSSDFAREIVSAEQKKTKFVKVGNLSAVRDFLDVRDAVKALWLLAKKGRSGETYNLASGKKVTVRRLLREFIRQSTAPIIPKKSKALMRPLDEPVKVGNIRKLHALGWRPKITLQQTVRDILIHHRQRNIGDEYLQKD